MARLALALAAGWGLAAAAACEDDALDECICCMCGCGAEHVGCVEVAGDPHRSYCCVPPTEGEELRVDNATADGAPPSCYNPVSGVGYQVYRGACGAAWCPFVDVCAEAGVSVVLWPLVFLAAAPPALVGVYYITTRYRDVLTTEHALAAAASDLQQVEAQLRSQADQEAWLEKCIAKAEDGRRKLEARVRAGQEGVARARDALAECKERVGAQTAALGDMEAKLVWTAANAREAEGKVVEMEARRQQAQEALKRLKGEAAAKQEVLDAKLNALAAGKSADQLAHELSEANAALEAARHDEETAREALVAARQQRSLAKGRVTKLAATHAALAKELDDVKLAVEVQRREYHALLNTVGESVEAARQELSPLVAELEAFAPRVDDLYAKDRRAVAVVEEREAVLAGRRDAKKVGEGVLAAKHAAADGALKLATTTHDVLRERQEALETDEAELVRQQALLREVEGKLKDKDGELKALQQEYREKTEQCAGIAKQTSTLRAAKASIEGDITETREKVREQEQSATAREERVAALQERRSDLAAQLDAKLATLHDLTASVGEFSKELGLLQDEVRQLPQQEEYHKRASDHTYDTGMKVAAVKAEMAQCLMRYAALGNECREEVRRVKQNNSAWRQRLTDAAQEKLALRKALKLKQIELDGLLAEEEGQARLICGQAVEAAEMAAAEAAAM